MFYIVELVYFTPWIDYQKYLFIRPFFTGIDGAIRFYLPRALLWSLYSLLSSSPDSSISRSVFDDWLSVSWSITSFFIVHFSFVTPILPTVLVTLPRNIKTSLTVIAIMINDRGRLKSPAISKIELFVTSANC